jgi:hypothetical protein
MPTKKNIGAASSATIVTASPSSNGSKPYSARSASTSA